MHCRDYGNVATTLIGLHKVGIIGLHGALKEVEQSGLSDREAIVDRLIEILAEENYIPPSQAEGYRRAVWREFLRRKGADFRDFYSEVEVIVRSGPGDMRDRFVFGDFELKPLVTLAEPEEGDSPPQLRIGEHVIVEGLLSRRAFKEAVRKSLSDW
jgi:hypothetical protein